jgi:cytochrome c556
MKVVSILAVAAAAFALAIPASAQFAKPEDAVKYRQSAMFIMGQNFGRIGAMVNGKAPYDPAAAETSAQVVAEMAKLPWPGFAANTDKLPNATTKAKSEIWAEPAKFKQASEHLQDEAPKLASAAKAHNLDTLKTQFNETAKACKGCHDDFRSK